MKKILIVLLINVFTFANLFADINTFKSNEDINKSIENKTTEKLSNLKNQHEEFINKLEFTTFCTKENLKNNEVRKALNEFVVYLKQNSVKNILFAILAFLSVPILLIINSYITNIPPNVIIFLFGLVLFGSDLYYNNPLAIIGFYIDWISTGIKLFLAIFGIYITNLGKLVLYISIAIGIIILLGIIISWKKEKNMKRLTEAIKNIFYIVAMSDGKLSSEEEKFLRKMIYSFAKELDLDKEIAKKINEEEANNVNPNELKKFLNVIKSVLDKETLKKYFIEDIVKFALIDGINDKKKEIIYTIASELGYNIDLDEFINSSFDNTENMNINEYYRILGIENKNISCDDLKRKYRELAKKYHPDKIKGKQLDEAFIKFAEEMFKKINEAYEEVKLIKGC